MIEIRGREIRTSEVDEEISKQTGGGIPLKLGQTVELRVDSPTCYTTDHKIHVNFRDLPRLVKPNDLLYLDDGKIVLLVVDCSMEAVVCEVKQGGVLVSNTAIKMPAGKHENMPIMQVQDQEDLTNMVNSGELHYVAVPYTVRKRDITQVKEALG